MGFRKDQVPIMEYNKGQMAVPSVPGAGKTYILTHLAAKLIKEKCEKKEKVLIVTFMKSAVSNFKTKLENLVGNKNKYDVMTIHSLAMKIIKEKPEKVKLADDFAIIEPIEREKMIDQCIAEYLNINENNNSVLNFIDKSKRNINNIKKWKKEFKRITSMAISEIKLRDMEKIDNKSEEISLLKEIFNIYLAYEKRLKVNGKIDYDDILKYAYKILCIDNETVDKYSEKYKYIFEDEAQDSNILQGKILEMLSKKNNNFVRVGDPNQSILSTFTTSDPKYFIDYIEKTNNVKKMSSAGRCSKEIVDIANYLVNFVNNNYEDDDMKKSLFKQLIKLVEKGEEPQNPQVDEKGVFINKFENWEIEKKYIGETIKELKEEKPNLSIAVLVPAGFMITDLSKKFDTLNIDYQEISDISKEKLKALILLGELIDFINLPFSNERFFNILRKFIDFEDEKYYEKIKTSLADVKLEDVFFPRGGKIANNIIENIVSHKEFIKLEDLILKLKKILNFPKNAIDRLIIFISNTLDFDTEEKAISQIVAGDLKNRYLSENSLDLIEVANELKRPMKTIYGYYAKMIFDIKGFEPDFSKVNICTYHKSKGLEWDVVFLTGITSKFFPAGLDEKLMGENDYLMKGYEIPSATVKAEIKQFSENKKSENPVLTSKKIYIGERIRLLYVGITRAKKYLYLNGSKGVNSSVSRFLNYLFSFKEV